MQTPEVNDQSSCPSTCQGCWVKLGLIPAEGLTGWRLVLAAAGAFLSPLIQAILGAVLLPLVWHSPHSQAVGALGGLALGLVDSVFLAWCIKGAGNRRA